MASTRNRTDRTFWDKQAAGYDGRSFRMYKNAYDLSIQKARSVVSAEQRVLDIGCGTGIVTLGIAPYVKQVVATDISPRMISVAKEKARRLSITNVDFRLYDGDTLPYDDESFDTVLLFNALHVVQDPAALLRQAHRLLKPGGRLATATDCYAEPVPFPVRLMLTGQKLFVPLGLISTIWYFRKEELHRLFEDNSFVVIDSDVLHPAPVNYYLLASKEK